MRSESAYSPVSTRLVPSPGADSERASESRTGDASPPGRCHMAPREGGHGSASSSKICQFNKRIDHDRTTRRQGRVCPSAIDLLLPLPPRRVRFGTALRPASAAMSPWCRACRRVSRAPTRLQTRRARLRCQSPGLGLCLYASPAPSLLPSSSPVDRSRAGSKSPATPRPSCGGEGSQSRADDDAPIRVGLGRRDFPPLRLQELGGSSCGGARGGGHLSRRWQVGDDQQGSLTTYRAARTALASAGETDAGDDRGLLLAGLGLPAPHRPEAPLARGNPSLVGADGALSIKLRVRLARPGGSAASGHGGGRKTMGSCVSCSCLVCRVAFYAPTFTLRFADCAGVKKGPEARHGDGQTAGRCPGGGGGTQKPATDP